MKLTDIMNKTMKEVLAGCDVIDQKIHTDDNGNIKAIEMKYQPNDTRKEVEVPNFNTGGH